MPVRGGEDKNGKYYQWGYNGKRYYYKTERGEKTAKGKAEKQGRAIHANKKF